MGAEGTIWGDWNSRFLLAQTGEEHQRLRMLVAKTFTPRSADNHRPIMAEGRLRPAGRVGPQGGV